MGDTGKLPTTRAEQGIPTKDELIALMNVCIDHRDTSWFYEWNLIDLHNAIHRYYGINEREQVWFNEGTEEVHGNDDS